MIPALLHFPGPEVREEIHQTICQYAAGELSRLQMYDLVNTLLDMYKVKKLTVRKYTVKQSMPVETPAGTFPVIIIEASHKVYDRCPACGSDDGRYLAGEAPAIKAWCMDCGCIYRKEVRDEEACTF